MPSPKFRAITSMYSDFDSLARESDRAIYGLMQFALSRMRRGILPKSLRLDRFEVERAENYVTIHLYSGEKEKGRFTFVPPPTFSRH